MTYFLLKILFLVMVLGGIYFLSEIAVFVYQSYVYKHITDKEKETNLKDK